MPNEKKQQSQKQQRCSTCECYECDCDECNCDCHDNDRVSTSVHDGHDNNKSDTTI